MQSFPACPCFRTGILALRAAILGFFLPIAAFAQSSGIVAGQVSNSATSAFLDGAEISVEGSGRSALSDREGRFELVLDRPAETRIVVAKVVAGVQGRF